MSHPELPLAAKVLAIRALQTSAYQQDPEFKDAVDRVLSMTNDVSMHDLMNYR